MSEPPPLLLVVDDHDAGRFAKCELFRRYGYRVIDAGTGQDTLRLAESQSPDVVVLDVQLPDINGIEVCRRLRLLAVPLPVQVLQLSSTAITDADRVAGLMGGADAYLTEPVAPEVLIATIRSLLRVRQAEKNSLEALERERTARAEAERANRFKDEFLATLSHELRTPLSTMVGWIWQLRQGPLSEAVLKRALDALERSTQLQVKLIEDLLDISRISKGKMALSTAHVDLAALITTVVESLRPSANARQTALSVDLEPVHVIGDAPRLQQIIGNLLTNAIQYSRDRGAVRVSLRREGGDAVIRVRDEGQGIESSLLPYIFELFRQGESALNRRHGGLGLGLAIVRQIAELHGGSVQADSPGVGLGSTFTVRLPANDAAATPSEVPIPQPQVRLDGTHVLVLDDDEHSRQWMQALIQAAGGTVTAVERVADALQALGSATVDLIVSDIGMPGANGLDLIRQVRQEGSRIPAVAVTAFATLNEQRQILASGYDAYFSKPLDPSAFLTELSGLWRR